MSVVLLLAAAAILVAVVVVASGRGGEMASPRPDYASPDLGPVTAADVALLRPPSAAWGYNMRVTDEALERIARAIQERDVRIVALQRQVADLRESREAGSAQRVLPSEGPTGPVPLPRRAPSGHAVPDRDQDARGQDAREQWAREGQESQEGQEQAGQGPGQGRPGPGQAGERNRTAGEAVTQGRVIPRHAAMRPPSGHEETPGRAWYGPAPGPGGRGDRRREGPGG